MRNQPLGAVVYGVDLGKTRFDVVGCDASGRPTQRVKFSCDTLFAFFAVAPKALIGMEACPGAQWMARKLRELGHTVRIIPAQFVKPFVKSNKNDARDAEAIAEAVTRPTMRFVEIKPTEQLDLQALHRIRDRIVANRTQLICQMRAFCLEYGLAIRQGTGTFKLDIASIIADEANDLTPAMRGLLTELWEELKIVDVRLAAVSRQVEILAARHDAARRLMTTRNRADWSDRVGRGGRRCPPIPEGTRSCRMAWPGAAAKLHRRQNDVAGNQQAWKSLCPPASH